MFVKVYSGDYTTAVCLSYYHRKLGPVVQCTSPGDFLPEEDKQAITGQLDKVHVKENFMESAVGGEKTALNYFFEIPSPWSQQNKEKLMLSIIFEEKMHPRSQEDQIRLKVRNFAQELKENAQIFKGFYFQDRFLFHAIQRKQILTANMVLQKMLNEFRRSLDIKLELISSH